MLYSQFRQDFLSVFSRDIATKDYFDPIDGLRAIANLVIILCHSVTIFSAFVPSYPHVLWNEFVNSQAFILAPLMTLVLETFFMLSAFLLTHKLITQWTKDDKSYCVFLREYPKSILKRALRFWPGILLATIMMCICGEFRYINPTKYLLSIWLFVQNYVDNDYWLTTLTHLWTISLDMQVYILLPLLLYVLYACRRNVDVFNSLALLLLVSIIRSVIVFDPKTMPVIPSISRYNPFALLIPEHTCIWVQSHYKITFLFDCQSQLSNLLQLFMQKMYYALEARFGSFIVGAMLAIKIVGISQDYDRNGTVRKYLFLSLIFAHMVLLATQKIDSPLMSDLAVSLSMASSRQIFAIGQAFILFTALCPPSHPYHAPWIRRFLSSSIWIPISKLSYLVYIIHWPLSFELVFGEHLLFLTKYSVVHAAIISLPIILFTSQIFSCIWLLLIEKPFERVIQVYFSTKKSNKK